MPRGSIRKRGAQRYQIRLRIGTDDSGRPVRIEKSVAGTRSQAEAALSDLIRQHSAGGVVDPSKQPLSDYLEHWLRLAKAPKLAPKTLTHYESLIRKHYSGPFGRLPLRSIRPVHVQDFYAGLDGGPSLVRQIHVILNQALDQAVRWQMLATNPVQSVERPRGRARKAKRDIRAMNQDQARRFLAAAGEDRWHVLWQLLLASSMRPQEALGLQWPEVDFSADTVRVVQALIRLKGGGWRLDPPKTRLSRRSIVLPSSVMELLRQHQVDQHEAMKVSCAPYEDNQLVFATATGSPLGVPNLRIRHFLPTLKRAGLSGFRVYDLRHTGATLLLLQGQPAKVVSERLGHATVTLTLDTYSSVLPTMQRQAAAALEATGLF